MSLLSEKTLCSVASLLLAVTVAACSGAESDAKTTDQATGHTVSDSAKGMGGDALSYNSLSSDSDGKNQGWVDKIAKTPQGGILIGNPDARVKVLEFASYTCPHCAAFEAEGLPVLLSKYVSSGDVSVEFRPFSLNGLDLTVGLVAFCRDPRASWALVRSIFAMQDKWVSSFKDLDKKKLDDLQALPIMDKLKGFARIGKLDRFFLSRGFPKEKFDSCLSDKKSLDGLQKISQEAVSTYNVQGTPGFVLNGRLLEDVFDWQSLEPKIQKALKN